MKDICRTVQRQTSGPEKTLKHRHSRRPRYSFFKKLRFSQVHLLQGRCGSDHVSEVLHKYCKMPPSQGSIRNARITIWSSPEVFDAMHMRFFTVSNEVRFQEIPSSRTFSEVLLYKYEGHSTVQIGGTTTQTTWHAILCCTTSRCETKLRTRDWWVLRWKIWYWCAFLSVPLVSH